MLASEARRSLVKKVLFVATVSRHILSFHLPFLEWFKDHGYTVHVASKGQVEIPFCDKHYELSIERNPIKKNNIKAYWELKELIKIEDYDIIHCHTPMGGALCRLAARDARKKGTKVFYTAHGFHFFKGAKLVNWLIYYPIEKQLAKYTDYLIVINQEDYETAKKGKFKAGRLNLVPGVGVNINRFKPRTEVVKKKLRLQLGYSEDSLIAIYVGELSNKKNQDLIIQAVSLIKDRAPDLIVLLVGSGESEKQYLSQIEKLRLENRIYLLGYRNDVDKLMALSDIALSSSRREGLPVNVMEAMATGLPLVVSNCRGNRDLVSDGVNGYVVPVGDAQKFAGALEKLYQEEDLRKQLGNQGVIEIQRYGLEKIVKQMEEIYLFCIRSDFEVDAHGDAGQRGRWVYGSGPDRCNKI